MKFLDDMPIYIVIAALVVNIAIGVKINIGFTALMIRCIIVIVVFGLFGHLTAETIKNAVTCSQVGGHNQNKDAAGSNSGNGDNGKTGVTIDIKVPPIEDSEYESLGSENDSDFVEMNPAYMNEYNTDK